MECGYGFGAAILQDWTFLGLMKITAKNLVELGFVKKNEAFYFETTGSFNPEITISFSLQLFDKTWTVSSEHDNFSSKLPVSTIKNVVQYICKRSLMIGAMAKAKHIVMAIQP